MAQWFFDEASYRAVQEERRELQAKILQLDRHYDELEQAGDPAQDQVFDDLMQHRDLLKTNKQRYYQQLPQAKFSICPFTGEELTGPFDPVGFDGPWWMEFTRIPGGMSQVPATFQVLRGAVDLHGQRCLGGEHNALIGPGLPYVIPRILELPGMVMVVSRLTMLNGCDVYPLAYFSSQEPPPGQLTSTWLEKDQCYFTDASGTSRWRVPTDPWDFDIGAWIARGKVRWILPDQSELAAASTDPKNCPYVGLTGVRFPQKVSDRGVSTSSLPNPNADYSPGD